MRPFRILAFLLLAGYASLTAQQGVGVKYGSRDPHTCANMKTPAKGALSADQARQYFICGAEAVKGEFLYLMEDVKVEIGKGTPYRDIPQIHRPGNADADGLVYQIRGSYKRYQCAAQSNIAQNIGKNCNVYDQPKATGNCYRDNFGEWQCGLNDFDSNIHGTVNQAPPK